MTAWLDWRRLTETPSEDDDKHDYKHDDDDDKNDERMEDERQQETPAAVAADVPGAHKDSQDDEQQQPKSMEQWRLDRASRVNRLLAARRRRLRCERQLIGSVATTVCACTEEVR